MWGIYLALVGEFGGGDIQLLILLLQLGELSLQARLLQFSGVQLALQVLVVGLQALVIFQQLLVCGVQPGREKGEETRKLRARKVFTTFTLSDVQSPSPKVLEQPRRIITNIE